MSEDLVVIPGFAYNKGRYSKLIDFFSEDYDVHFFCADYHTHNSEVVDSLKEFLEEEEIGECHFITHSYGAVILRLFYQEEPEVFLRSVELGPPNQGSEVLETFGQYPFVEHVLGIAYQDFLEHEDEIEKLPYPPRTGVLAGTKHFAATRIEAYVIPLVCHVHHSDGKVLIRETKFEGMQDFRVVEEYHTYLIVNDESLSLAKKFLGGGKF